MSLVLATTTVTVQDKAPHEPYEAPSWSTTASGVPAHIGQPSGSERTIGGSQEAIDAVLLAEAGTTIRHTQRIVDDTTGDTFQVAWVQDRQGLGLDHVKAGLRRTQGLANG